MNLKELAGRIKKKHALRWAVKEALDTLPSAVCYFTAAGNVKLCNTAMCDLIRKITQNDLQTLDELNEALDSCNQNTGVIREGNLFLFPDGHAWQYSVDKVTAADGRIYTEAVLSDVTELYEKRQKLQRQSRELKKMYRELKILSANVLEMTREEEILNLKSRLHDQMNMGVAAIRQILRQNTTSEENAAAIRQILRQNTTSEENAAAIAQFRRAIQVLQEENAYPQGDIAEFIRDAEVSGIRVEITGDFPEEKEVLHLLLPVLREACVNAARHADASVLYITAERKSNAMRLLLTNDGRQPQQEVIPRGGLVDLGRMLAEAGGKIEIQSQPQFLLTVTLPIGTEKEGVRK